MSYTSPIMLDHALAALAGGDVAVVAGGTDFFPSLQPGQTPASILDISRIEGLRGIARADDGGWRIGATTRWSDIVRADLPACFDGLKQAARAVGSVQIQNAGTIAGNLCNASPAADGMPPLLCLEASVVLQSTSGERVLPLGEFVTGVRQTALRQGEVVTAILIPPQPDHARSSFVKLGARRYLVISIAMSAALIGVDTGGRIDFARIAVGACSPVATRLPALESAVIGKTASQVCVTPHHLASLSPITDVRGSAAYRLDAVAEQLLRAIRGAAGNG